MKLGGFEWDKKNEEHISRHNVAPEEVEELFQGYYRTYKTQGGKHVVYGKTDAGRYLLVVVAKKESRLRVVTARDMVEKEKKLLRRKIKRKGGK